LVDVTTVVNASASTTCPIARTGTCAEDADAVRYLRVVHGPLLTAYVRQLTDTGPRAAGILVESILSEAQIHPDARGADGQWRRAWLLGEARRRSVECRPTAAAGVEFTGDDAVRTALRSLPDDLRTTLVLIYLQARPLAEVADLLAVPAETVKTRAYAGLRALRDALREQGVTPGPQPDSLASVIPRLRRANTLARLRRRSADPRR
jgi:RNA polymerase sigma-70 factor, ECF subfamily